MKILFRITQVFLSLFGISVLAIFLLGLRLLWGPMEITSFFSTTKEYLGCPQDITFQKAFIKYEGIFHPFYIVLQDVSFGKEDTIKSTLKELEIGLDYQELLKGHVAFEHVYLKKPDIFLQIPQEEIKDKPTLDFSSFFEELLKDFPEVTIEQGSFSYKINEDTSFSFPQYTLALHKDKNSPLIFIELQAPFVTLKGDTSFFLKDMTLKGTYNPKDGTLFVRECTVIWMDKVKAYLEGQLALNGSDQYVFDVKGKTEGVSLSAFPEIWPSFLAPSPRTWVIENLSVGKVAAATLHAKGTFSPADQQVSLSLLNGALDLEDITVDYLTGLPFVEHVYGKATYTDTTFNIEIEQGVLSDVKVVGGTLLFSQLDTDEEMAHINLELQGPLRTVLWVIDHPPLSYPTKIGLHPDDFTGQTNLTLTLDFPLLKNLSIDKIQLQATADLSELTYIRDFLGTQLKFSEGKGDLAVTKEKMLFKAAGNLEDVPTSLQWQEIFKNSKSDFTLQGVYPIILLKKLGIDIGSEATGDFGLVLQLYKSDKQPLRGHMKVDLTQSAFSIPLLQWVQKQGNKTKAEIDFSLLDNKNILEVTSATLTASDIDLKGAFSLDTDIKTLLKADFPLFNTPLSKASLALNAVPSKEGTSFYNINIEGTSLDLSSFLEENKKDTSEDKGMFTLKAKVDELYLRQGYPIKAVLLTFEKQAGRIKKLLLHGNLGDKKPVEILFGKRPKKPGEILRIYTLDAGDFLRAIDFYDDIEGGILRVEGTRQEHSAEAFLEGKATLKEFRLKETPVIAKILSLASLQGVTDVLGGKGVYFKSANLIFRVNDATLEIYKGLAESTATGVSLEGTIDRIQKILSLKGTIIPVYVLNALISNIPLLGDILSGGKEKGFWATSFSVTGSSSEPKVSVNPLSALTPGFLRNIFEM